MFVGDVNAGDDNVVCLQKTSKSGTTFSIADIASGASAGTYYTKARVLDDDRDRRPSIGSCGTELVTAVRRICARNHAAPGLERARRDVRASDLRLAECGSDLGPSDPWCR